MLWKKESAPLSLICDIGSAHVGLGLIDRSSEKPSIISFVRVPLTISESFDQKTLEVKIVSFFEQAVADLETNLKKLSAPFSGKNIDSVYLIFSSPWYVSRTKNVVFEKDNEFILDQHTLESLLDEEEKKFEAEALKGNFPALLDRDIHMIERELIRVKLNGYDTPNPFMKRANNVELTLYMSLVPHILLEKMGDIIKRRFHTDTIKNFTFPVVSFGSIVQLFPLETDYLILDISGEVTDVSFVSQNSIRGSISFPSGRNTLVRFIAQRFGVLPEIALSFLSLYASDTLEETMKVSMNQTLNQIIKMWSDELSLAIQKIASYEKNTTLRTFVTLNQDTAPLFVDNLKKITNPLTLDVFVLSSDFIGDRVQYGKYVERDSFVALQVFYLKTRGLL